MSRSEVGSPATGPGRTFLRNLPVVLLFCVGYFVFFSFLWGPLRPWKIAMAASIVIGLCLGLDLRDPWRRVRRARSDRSAENRWPIWRRAGAFVAGVLICSAGIYQATGQEVDVGRFYPLLSGLCVIVSLAFGIILIANAQPRAPWRRRARRRSRYPSPDPKAAPRRQVRMGGSTMPMPMPKDQGYLGIWGGVGRKPAASVWKPGGSKSSEGPPEPVPRRFRRLRLFRRTRSSEAPASLSAWIVLGLLAAGIVLGLAFWLARQ